MKKLLLILLLSPLVSRGQTATDSLNRRILLCNDLTRTAHINIKKAETSFEAGSLFISAGIVFTALDLFILSKEKDPYGKPYKSNSKYIGFGLITFGTVFQIRGYKYLRKSKKLTF